MTKAYDPPLDEKTRKILEPVYAAILAYIGAQRKEEEPENPDDYKSWDKICTLPDGTDLWLEFEVRDTDGERRIWVGVEETQFSRSTVHVPERKRDSRAHLYVATNRFGTAFVITTLELVKASNVSTIDARNEQDMSVFNVSAGLWDFYLVKNGTLIAVEPTEEERYLRAAGTPTQPCTAPTPGLQTPRTGQSR